MSLARRPCVLVILACLALLALEEWLHAARRARATSRIAGAARAFLTSLREEQRAQALLPFDAPARQEWHFVPGERKGIALAALDDGQRRALQELLGTWLSTQGYLKVTGIVELEATLRELERNPARDPGRYWLACYGEPGSGAWTLRFEGHHVSLNLSGDASGLVGVTPFFLGTNPASLPDGPRAGLRLLRREEEIARELYLGLDEGLRKRATLPGDVPADVILAPGRPGSFEKAEGLSFAELPPAALALAWQLVDEVVGDLAPEAGQPERARLAALPAGALRFAWCGSTRPGEPHYWRISGPECAFELDNVQGGANHVHRLWRDRVRDLGGDALREHYRREHGR